MSIKQSLYNLKDSIEGQISSQPYPWMAGSFILGAASVSILLLVTS